MNPAKKFNVFFLCTGNSCRSEKAEGLELFLGSEVKEGYSAGTQPIGINLKAIRVIEEIGIDLASQSSKSIEAVETLCGEVTERCPTLPHKKSVKSNGGIGRPGQFRRLGAKGPRKFRETRDLICSLVKEVHRGALESLLPDKFQLRQAKIV